MNSKNRYDPEKHMAMLQYSLRDGFNQEKPYSSVTIDVKNAKLVYSQVSQLNREAIIKTIEIDDEAMQELLQLVSIEKFDNYKDRPRDAVAFEYFAEMHCFVCYDRNGIYSAKESYRVSYDEALYDVLMWLEAHFNLKPWETAK